LFFWLIYLHYWACMSILWAHKGFFWIITPNGCSSFLILQSPLLLKHNMIHKDIFWWIVINIKREEELNIKKYKDDLIFSLFLFFLFTWGVQIILRAHRLIPTGPEVNDQVNLQWPSILATTGRANLLIPSFYHWITC
jgi:hypothetical protein